ncbi:MAG TPA: protein kinase [Pyrinomonadaceae bacterium]|nr:protein kinase [Pyrinomonadaceae bacterium]
MLTSDTRLGPYEIIALLGAGGMGEVYRARDTRLGRTVAIKVLPPSFSSNAERLLRFHQEACAAGALNHPNILSIYDTGTHDGSPYVVSELLEGQTLRQRLSGTALSRRKAIDYALQIAHGLAAAHEKGIVHRDLKPENLFVTNDGRVKILDFGLAKLTGAADGDLSQTSIPTRRVDTDPGKIMGTAGYMSPEQVKGRPVDHRSDIFSFGAILYEMLSGKRAFHGESPAETLSAILKEDPPELSDTNERISPALERLVNHCLEKNPEERFHSARDLAFALEALSGTGSSFDKPATIAAPALRSRTRERFIWIVVIAVLIFAVALAFSRFRNVPDTARTTKFFISPAEQSSFTGSLISPDGRALAISGRDSSGKSLIWIRALDSLTMQPLSGTEGAAYPFWSADSRSLGFFEGGKLKRIDISGGPTQTLCDAGGGAGGAWNRDGVIIFSPDTASLLFRVSSAGGVAVPITTFDEARQEVSHKFPQFLSDGKHFLYLAQSVQAENTGIYAGALDSKETKRVLSTRAKAAYMPPGYMLFLRDRTLMAQPFDAGNLQVTGEPLPLAQQVGFNAVLGVANFSVSDNGVLTYMSGSLAGGQPALFDRDGKRLNSVGPPGEYFNIFYAPDEKRFTASISGPQSGSRDIWVVDIAHGTPTRLTFDPAEDFLPIWSPDGSRIVFSSDRDGPGNLFQKSSSGAGNEELLLKTDERKSPSDWSKDGRFIIYTNLSQQTKSDLWVFPVTGDQQPFPYLQSTFNEDHPRFSPDGHFVAYDSDESGKFEVYVQTFPASGGKWLVSTNGGAQPRWRRDGKEMFFIAADRRLMAVDVKLEGSTFEAGVPKALFQTNVAGYPNPRNVYDVSADGRRFLIITPLEEISSTPITVVTNWNAGLTR